MTDSISVAVASPCVSPSSPASRVGPTRTTVLAQRPPPLSPLYPKRANSGAASRQARRSESEPSRKLTVRNAPPDRRR